METQFKTFVTSKEEYGVIQFGAFSHILIGISERPELYDKNTTIEDLKNYYSKFKNYETDEVLNWEKDIPSDWKLIDITLQIILWNQI